MERFSSRVTPTQEYTVALSAKADQWVAACGGLEEEFEHQGSNFLYVYNPGRDEHGYLNLGTDIVTPDAPWEN